MSILTRTLTCFERINKQILHTDGVNMLAILAYEAYIETSGNYRWHSVDIRRANKQADFAQELSKNIFTALAYKMLC